MTILVFKVSYKPATNVKASYFTVECVNSGEIRKAKFNYSANNATRAAIKDAFGYDDLEFINHTDKRLCTSMWAVNT